jgi:hypothetical protein
VGKTETIKKRAIYVYLPSIGMVEDWKSRAERENVSISKFVIERVEDSIQKEVKDESYLSRLQLIERLSSLEEELKEFRQENRLLKKLVDNLDGELRRYRVKPFIDKGFTGVRSFDRELISILKRGGTVNEDDLLEKIGIDRSDIDLVKAVNRQLEALENYDLIVFTSKGWRWKE